MGYGTLCGNVLVQLAASIFRVVEKNKVCARNGGVIKGKSGLGNWCSGPAGELFLWSSFGCGEHIRNKSQNEALGGRNQMKKVDRKESQLEEVQLKQWTMRSQN